MKKTMVLLPIILITFTLSAHRLVRVSNITESSVRQLFLDGFDIANVDLRLGYADLMIPDAEVDQLYLLFPDFELLPQEWSELLPENARDAGYYYSPEENWEFWSSLSIDYPDLADAPVTIGYSYLDRNIYMVRLTSPVGSEGYKPSIYFSSLIHAREPGSNSVLIDFAMWLTSNYDGGDTRAAWILDNTSVYFVPVANPDGYAYNMPNGGNQRKNMNWTLGDGVDLNRNWSFQWGYDNYGSSGNPDNQTYRGTSPFSEPENRVQRNFIVSVKPIAAMNYHTYGGYLIYPWGYNNSPTPDQSTFETWGAAMTSYNGYAYGRAGQLLYTVNGEQNDWCYCGECMPMVYAFTPEVDDLGFWGSQNDTTAIVNFCEECRYMNIWLCMNAPEHVGIGENPGMVVEHEMSLGTVYPNPAYASAEFIINLPEAGQMDLAVYDMIGRRIQTLSSRELSAGENVVTWNIPDDISTGVYIIRISDSNGVVAGRRFTVLK